LAEPGGICVSDEVQHAIRNQPGLETTPLGERTLKNVGRPVGVYAVTGEVEPPPLAQDLALPGMDELTVPGFGGAPAIAVLPFDNLSGDPEQEYFADGLAEDLITRLSTFRIPVIARNSSFTYKGEPVDVKRVGRELGVRYVVEGSVRGAEQRVRISAQLIDATTGQHVWAERYDRQLVDVFAVQDEVTEAIVGSVYPAWMRSERERVARRAPESLDAWESVNRGSWHLMHVTREENARARSFFERAIELDPRSSPAFAFLAQTHVAAAGNQWTDDLGRSIAAALRAAETAVALDDNNAFGHVTLGASYQYSGQLEKAIAALERAVELSPSSAQAYSTLGGCLAGSGRVDEGLESLERAIRLSPRDPFLWYTLSNVAMAHFAAERYSEAVKWARRSLQQKPGNSRAYRYLAASHGHLGETDEAWAALQEYLRLEPDFSSARLRMLAGAFEPAFIEHLVDGLRKAGLEE
jgi:adenylate cyclase